MNDLLNEIENELYDPDCALLISNTEGLSIIQAQLNNDTRELVVDPKRFWHKGAHNLEQVLQKYRQSGYRVDLIGNDQGNIVYTVIEASLILSPQTLVSALMQWLRQN